MKELVWKLLGNEPRRVNDDRGSLHENLDTDDACWRLGTFFPLFFLFSFSLYV